MELLQILSCEDQGMEATGRAFLVIDPFWYCGLHRDLLVHSGLVTHAFYPAFVHDFSQ